jgi:hypothetical protein
MPPKKSMKNIKSDTKPEINNKIQSKNMFSALLSDDDDVDNVVDNVVENVVDNVVENVVDNVVDNVVENVVDNVVDNGVENGVETNKQEKPQEIKTIKLTEFYREKDNKQEEDKQKAILEIKSEKAEDKQSERINISEFVETIKQKKDAGFRNKSNMRYDDKMLEYKQIYDDNEEHHNLGNELKLNSHWTIWIHKSDNPDWTLNGYQKRYIINSIGSFWRFFNNFQFYDCYKNQLFIMRGEIAPIWEDHNNKCGGICSIKVDSTQRGFRTDISTEIFISICMLIMNETFIMNNDDINGISYAVKKKNILIKIWTKSFYENDKFQNEMPKQLLNKFNTELQKQLMNIFGPDYKMSIQYKQIKPEYEL